MVRRARQIDENNILGASLLDRAVDNIIGEQMVVEPTTDSPAFNDKVAGLWKDYSLNADERMVDSFPELQRKWYRARLRDGDIGIILLRSGRLQSIESDFIQSPNLFDDTNGKIVEGVELSASGRPLGFHIATSGQPGNTSRVRGEDFVWNFKNTRLNRTAIRGVSVLAELAPLLDQIDGTIEAVVMAHRMSALFGLIRHSDTPATSFNNLANTTTNADGNEQKSITLEPGMVAYVGQGEVIDQIRPEHPSTNFSEFMSFLIRVAGLKLGLPLELALLDFSRTNYSSARASMEQAYRHFRVEQKMFARTVLSRIYRWRVSKWIKAGELEARDDAWSHIWTGQPWPYLDPQKEAEGSLVAIDGGLTTLTLELLKRGITFDEWLASAKTEADKIAKAGIIRSRSRKTRELGTEPITIPPGANDDDDE